MSFNALLTRKTNQLRQLSETIQQFLSLTPISGNTLKKSKTMPKKFSIFVYKSLRLFIILISMSVLSISYASTPDSSMNKLSKMSCKELLKKLVKTSSYGTKFMNKKNKMGFYFERSDNDHIGLVFVNNAFSPEEMVYANSRLDLVNNTFKIIDSESPILIDINKQYIPYIANKCTPDQNEYRRGKYPDPQDDGILIERHEHWKHPVLAVFEKYGFFLNKVSYSTDGKFPTFYIVLKYPKHMAFDSKDAKKMYLEIIKANSCFPYAIVEQDENLRVDVGWSDKEKKLINIEFNKNAQAETTRSFNTVNDVIIVDKIYITNRAMPISQTDSVTQATEDRVLTGDNSVDKFTNKDSIIYFMADISVFRPSKKYYNVVINCSDSKGKTVYQGTVKRSLSGYSYKLGNALVKGYNQTLGLDPKLNAMINGQRMPLVNGQHYYIQLIVENKLISITKFSYEVVDESAS